MKKQNLDNVILVLIQNVPSLRTIYGLNQLFDSSVNLNEYLNRLCEEKLIENAVSGRREMTVYNITELGSSMIQNVGHEILLNEIKDLNRADLLIEIFKKNNESQHWLI